MKRCVIPSAFTACAGLLVTAAVAAGAPRVSSSDGDSGQSRPQQQSSPAASSSSSAPREPANNSRPIPADPRVPLPQGGSAPIGTDRLPDVPPPRDRTDDNINRPPKNFGRTPRNYNIPPRNYIIPPDNNYNRTPDNFNNRPEDQGKGDRPGDSNHDGDRDRDRNHDRDHDGPWRYRRPPIGPYGYGTYDPYRYYNDRYSGWDAGDPGYAPQPLDARDPRVAGDRDAAGPAPGALLPPEDLLDDGDVSPALRKALDASAPYREATAQLVRAWAEYARAAEQVLQHLKGDRRYQLSLAKLKDAEAKLAAVRDRGDKLPAVNVVTATQQAMLARREVRRLEQQAIDADPTAKRAKQQVD